MAFGRVPTHLNQIIRAYRQWPPFRGHAVTAFRLPFRARGIAVSDHNEVFVTNHFGDSVSVYSLAGTLLRRWGSTGGDAGAFLCPQGIAIAKHGEVVVADTYNHRVQVFRPAGEFVRMWGSHGLDRGQFAYPSNVAVTPSGSEVVVADGHDHIQVFRLSDGAFLWHWTTGKALDGSFHNMFVSVTSTNQVVTVDTSQCCVRVFELTGACLHKWGGAGLGPSQFDHPCGVAVRGHEVVVADCHNSRLQVFRLDGTFVSASALHDSTHLSLPYSLAVTRKGQLLLVQVHEPCVQVLE